MRISGVGNTVVYTRDLSEYILLVNDTSQVDIWLRNGESESSLCRSPRGAIKFPGLHFVVALFFCFVPRGKAQSTSSIRVAVY
jgi:hypothetical protein